MKIVSLEQGSADWLAWRRSRITATDAGVILGLSDYKEPFELWQEKKQLIPAQPMNDAMRHGQRCEPLARQLFIESFDLHVEPVVVESDEYFWMGASLDGIDETGKFIIEIKSPVRLDRHLSKIISSHYYAQMMHQLEVTHAEVCFFVSYHEEDPDKIWVKGITPNPEFVKAMVKKEEEFYVRHMCTMNPPEGPWKFVPK